VTRHDGAQRIAACGAEVKAQAGLRKHAEFPTMESVKGLHEVQNDTLPPARRLGGGQIDREIAV
jgi:hypothetical protein